MLCGLRLGRPLSTSSVVALSHRAQGKLAAMALHLLGHIELPANRPSGGFDHADIHAPTDRLYVAHTSNDAIDVIDIAQ